jgi:hypothetical protein
VVAAQQMNRGVRTGTAPAKGSIDKTKENEL